MSIDKPTQAQIMRSKRCLQTIKNAINDHAGSISFAQYMQICLYASEVGYYESGEPIFGAAGDFTTSPETSNYFAKAFANHIQQLANIIGSYSIIEVGAGSGKLASDLLAQLTKNSCLPAKYIIVEKSAALRTRQQQMLNQYSNDCEIIWKQSLDQPVDNAIVIANEVLDALPVDLITVRNNKIYEQRVAVGEQNNLIWVHDAASISIADAVRSRLPQHLLMQNQYDYVTEINLQMNQLVEKIASFVKQGIFFYIDYGYPRAEYYHDQRHMGTVICHYKNSVGKSALQWPGLQDITCNVDFTALAEVADEIGLQVDCYTTQAHFLLASNFLNDLQNSELHLSPDQQQQLKTLLMPGEMGERFQVMVLTKNIDLSCYQFTLRDLKHRL